MSDRQRHLPTTGAVRAAVVGAALIVFLIAAPAALGTGGRIAPDDLAYVGAFRLPDGPEEIGWAWSGAALAYYPQGDPQGADDGFAGSLFGTGHNWNQHVSEVSIPKPVVSSGKDLDALGTAKTLQDFANVWGDLYGEMEIPRVGLAILPTQGEQKTEKLYFSWGQHMDEGNTGPSHGWCELDLSNPKPAGAWRVGGFWKFETTDYLFVIPQAWASKNTPGKRLATGRFRDGGQGGQGPPIFAIGPWNDGNPPKRGATIEATPLLRYSTVYDDDDDGNVLLDDYHHADEWSGGAWLTAGGKSAVVLLGTKGKGDCWYGFRDGTLWPNEGNKEGVGGRGWWSTSFVAQMMFYDTNELAAVAKGERKPYGLQPYATLELDKLLFRLESPQQKHRFGACAFDRERGYLYVLEPLVDEDKSIVHVWHVPQ